MKQGIIPLALKEVDLTLNPYFMLISGKNKKPKYRAGHHGFNEKYQAFQEAFVEGTAEEFNFFAQYIWDGRKAMPTYKILKQMQGHEKDELWHQITDIITPTWEKISSSNSPR